MVKFSPRNPDAPLRKLRAFKLSDEVYKQLSRMAAAQGLTMAGLIENLIDAEYRRQRTIQEGLDSFMRGFRGGSGND